jgi:hypothetical protein
MYVSRIGLRKGVEEGEDSFLGTQAKKVQKSKGIVETILEKEEMPASICEGE